MKNPSIYTIALLITLSAPAAISQAEDKGDSKKAAKTEAKAGDGKGEKKVDVEVVIDADTLEYKNKEFTVSAGQVVKLTLKNSGTLPKAAGGHNLVILAKGTDVAAFAAKAIGSVANEYIPQDKESKAKILAYTNLLGPTESDNITFTAPAAGKYDYVCTFPGHYLLMKGVMVVKEKATGAKKVAGAKKAKEKK